VFSSILCRFLSSLERVVVVVVVVVVGVSGEAMACRAVDDRGTGLAQALTKRGAIDEVDEHLSDLVGAIFPIAIPSLEEKLNLLCECR